MHFIESDKIHSIVGDNRQLIHTLTKTVNVLQQAVQRYLLVYCDG